jgi:Flp pilus assembly protein TadG
MNRLPNLVRAWSRSLSIPDGSAIVELAVSLPLLVVFVVGIYDFSGAFNQKQKIEHAAQEGAIVAGAQPTSDIETTTGDPQSLHSVVTAIFNSLAANGVLFGSCTLSTFPTPTWTPGSLTWDYKIPCGSDNLEIKINRGWAQAVTGLTSTSVAGTQVTVTYPYHWHFNSAIQLLLPGPSPYSATTNLSETASVHNQM